MLKIVELENGNKKIIVPKGIRYISNWKDYSLSNFNFPHILDKKIPGCGFTEYCLRSNEDIIVCSPRRVLLENKELQHNYIFDKRTEEYVFNPDAEYPIFYFKNSFDCDIESDKDISKLTRASGLVPKDPALSKEEVQQVLNDLENELNNYMLSTTFKGKAHKIIVTYDSFKYVRYFLEKAGKFDRFSVVIDEFQAVFTDSTFKSDTELEFMYQIQDLQKVCFVSATPMIDKYLAMLDEFKNLPYYELDWAEEDQHRVIKPDLKIRKVAKSLVSQAEKIINTYKVGDFEEGYSKDSLVRSTEAVFYVNSVSNILAIIKKCGLSSDECNILCADTAENRKRIKKHLGKSFDIGKVPTEDQKHKMFTFCTRTVYLGADFYSKCARSFILSDANIDCLTVDITLDLPQILGRQRLNENPWKNRAELYYRTSSKSLTREEFEKILNKKCEKSYNLLNAYSDTRQEAKHDLAENYQYSARSKNYKDDYVAVNTHGGKDLVPVFNNLVYISQLRAFEVQQVEYADRFSVINTIEGGGIEGENLDDIIDKTIKDFKALSTFPEKLRLICESPLDELTKSIILDQIPLIYKNCYCFLGPARCKSLSYNKTEISRAMENLKIETDKDSIKDRINQVFKVGMKLTKQEIKTLMGTLYEDMGYNKTPKASDLEKYFKVRLCLIQNKETGKRDSGFEILEAL